MQSAAAVMTHCDELQYDGRNVVRKRLECKEMTSTFLSQNLTFWNLHFFASTGAIFQATLVKTSSWIRNINLPDICLNRNKNIRLLM